MIDYNELDYDALKKKGFLRSKFDGLLTLRTRKIAGNYNAKQLFMLGKIAKEYGRDIIHLTTRQGAEIPFVPYKMIVPIEKLLASVGICAGTSGARLRATTACPGSNWCKRGLMDTFRFAERLENEVGVVCGFDLPHKFKIVVSGCHNACTRAQCSEIGLHGTATKINGKTVVGYTVYIGGCGGRDTEIGFKLGEKIFSEEEALSFVLRVVNFFKDNAKPRQRLSKLIAEYGKENF